MWITDTIIYTEIIQAVKSTCSSIYSIIYSVHFDSSAIVNMSLFSLSQPPELLITNSHLNVYNKNISMSLYQLHSMSSMNKNLLHPFLQTYD